jgi:uncharacterized membrane protein YcaP (DUF421 family)
MDLVVRAAAIYLVVLLFTRILGRRELSQLQPFDLILLVLIGDLVQQGVTQSDNSVTGVLLVISTIGVLQVGTSYLSFKFAKLRPYLNGEPIVLVENGKVIDKNMKRERLSIDDLAEQARLNSIGSLDEVRWAVLESSGQISFVKKDS